MLPNWYVSKKVQLVVFVGLALVGAGAMLWLAANYG